MALGQRDFLRVWGGDYPTPDGTAIRDYIHVMDLAEGHVAAVANVLKNADFGCQAINLGTGTGEARSGSGMRSRHPASSVHPIPGLKCALTPSLRKPID